MARLTNAMKSDLVCLIDDDTDAKMEAYNDSIDWEVKEETIKEDSFKDFLTDKGISWDEWRAYRLAHEKFASLDLESADYECYSFRHRYKTLVEKYRLKHYRVEVETQSDIRKAGQSLKNNVCFAASVEEAKAALTAAGITL
jgi:hypothetical protein